jgi:hypothetical protein
MAHQKTTEEEEEEEEEEQQQQARLTGWKPLALSSIALE